MAEVGGPSGAPLRHLCASFGFRVNGSAALGVESTVDGIMFEPVVLWKNGVALDAAMSRIYNVTFCGIQTVSILVPKCNRERIQILRAIRQTM